MKEQIRKYKTKMFSKILFRYLYKLAISVKQGKRKVKKKCESFVCGFTIYLL